MPEPRTMTWEEWGKVWQVACERLRAENERLRLACEYAAGSFAQVPSSQTVPPIVLHDCKDKLTEALRSCQ